MIVTEIATLKKYISTAVGKDFDLLKAHVLSANNMLRDDILGSDLYALADTKDVLHTTLTEHCERVVCFAAYERAIPFLDLVQTDTGFAVTGSEGLAPASTARVKALTTATQAELDAAIEGLLAFLEGKPDYHDAWKGSPTYALLTDTYLSTLKEFRRYAALTDETRARYPQTRREFVALEGVMRKATGFTMASYISAELNEELLEQIRDNDLTAANKRLLEPLRFALAALALGQSSEADSYLRSAFALLKGKPDDYPSWRDSLVGKAELSRIEAKNDQPIFFAGL